MLKISNLGAFCLNVNERRRVGFNQKIQKQNVHYAWYVKVQTWSIFEEMLALCLWCKYKFC